MNSREAIMEEIKKLTHLNYKEVFDLSQYAFQYKLDEKAYLEKVEEAERHIIYGYYLNQKLAGKMHLIPLEVYSNNEAVKMGGISAVATWPEYAGKQIASKLMKRLLLDMYEQDYLVSYLHPYHISFYRRFGFELAFKQVETVMKIDLFKPTNDQAIFDRKPSLKKLNEIYKIYIKQFEGGLKRDEKWWKQRVLSEEERVTIHSEQGDAYLLYEIKDAKLSIKELAYTELGVLGAVSDFIAKHASMIDSVKLRSPQSHALKYYLENPKYKECVEPYFMARIINVRLFLKNFLKGKEFDELVLKVKDDLIKENNQVLKLSTQAGEVSIEPVLEEVSDFELKVHELTALCYNYYTVNQLIEFKKIQLPKSVNSTLNVLFENRQTAFIDYY